MNPIKVAILEDTDDIREMFQSLINTAPGYVCEYAYANAEDALEDVFQLNVDVFLTDVNLPGKSGIDFIHEAKPRMTRTQFVVCTVYEDDKVIFDALSAGATGYLLKNASSSQILEAIFDVHHGGSPMSLSVARRVVQHFSQPKFNSEAEVLTEREREILDLLSQGLLYKEIADKLSLAKGTVHVHIHNIYEKLEVSNRTEAINKAMGSRV